MTGGATTVPAMKTEAAGALYTGRVMHARLKPRFHRFSYAITQLYLDIDRLDKLDRTLDRFGHNRGRWFSFHDRDHGARDGTPLRPWVDAQCALAGVDLGGGPVRLLCFPRVFHHVFNPISVFFCFGPDNDLRAVIHEVSNTFGQSHSYVIPVPPETPEPIHQEADKLFHVSPFIPMDCRYRFHFRLPGERFSFAIHQNDAAGPLLMARMKSRREPLNDQTLRAALKASPLMSFKTLAAIHWEALRLFFKGAPVQPEPPLPKTPASVGRTLPPA